MRIPVVAGNWKMNKTPSEARSFVIQLREQVKDVFDREIILFPPFTALPVVAEELLPSRIRFGGQNLHWERSGAFTGEVSADFLVDLGCTHVLVGHSERRQVFAEDDDTCNRKLKTALDAGLVPVFCCGETLAERNADKTCEVLDRQLTQGLAGIKEPVGFLILYEPVWAIGTGQTATSAQAEAAHSWIRNWLATHRSGELAESTPILYGGSVRPDNIDDLMTQENIDGVGVGGASLDLASFVRIIHYQPPA